MRTIRVVLADDHAVMRIGIRNLLSRSPDIEVVGEGSNGLEAIELVNKFKPDVLVLDMEMPIMDGVEAARRLRESQSPVKILALSSYNDKYYILSLLEQGAAGYLTKDENPNTIIEAVRSVANGKRGWLSRKAAVRVEE
ncbi:MAG: response regulator transcription factor [Chloroflexi bacterium]|nr:response regulator transcription factor [Anaerolineaceae bacterium]NMB88681.1 response regulator transcription factor [Chloroflexota bacterium]